MCSSDLLFFVRVFGLRFSLHRFAVGNARHGGEYLLEHEPSVASFNVIKGFLNLTIAGSNWIKMLNAMHAQETYGITHPAEEAPLVMIEYSSPNTNKPLHLGHVRNNLLGYSLSEILKTNDNRAAA